MERFKIFPSIGIARLGGSKTEFYLCPESKDSLGLEIDQAGNESELKAFKDTTEHLIKRQGARFRIYELAANGEYKPADMSKISVEWKVRLVNKKAAVVRPKVPPPDAPSIVSIQDFKVTLPLKPNPEDLLIDGKEDKSISGKNKNGILFDAGKYKGTPVFLGGAKNRQKRQFNRTWGSRHIQVRGKPTYSNKGILFYR